MSINYKVAFLTLLLIPTNAVMRSTNNPKRNRIRNIIGISASVGITIGLAVFVWQQRMRKKIRPLNSVSSPSPTSLKRLHSKSNRSLKTTAQRYQLARSTSDSQLSKGPAVIGAVDTKSSGIKPPLLKTASAQNLRNRKKQKPRGIRKWKTKE